MVWPAVAVVPAGDVLVVQRGFVCNANNKLPRYSCVEAASRPILFIDEAIPPVWHAIDKAVYRVLRVAGQEAGFIVVVAGTAAMCANLLSDKASLVSAGGSRVGPWARVVMTRPFVPDRLALDTGVLAGLQPLLDCVRTRGRLVWALRAAARTVVLPPGTALSPVQCLAIVKEAGRQLWSNKTIESAERRAESALPFLAGYLGPGPVVAPLPGLTVAAMVARGYHEPAIHVGGGRVAAPQYVDITLTSVGKITLRVGDLNRVVEVRRDGASDPCEFGSVEAVATVIAPDAAVESLFALALARGAFSDITQFCDAVKALPASPSQLHARSADGAWFEHIGVAALVVASHLCDALLVGRELRVPGGRFVEVLGRLLGAKPFPAGDVGKLAGWHIPPMAAASRRLERPEKCAGLAGVCGLVRTGKNAPYDAVAYPLFAAPAAGAAGRRQ